MSSLNSFLKTHCAACHDASAKEGGLDVFSLPENVSSEEAMARWVRLHDRVAAGEMPPAEADQPPSDARREFLQSLSKSLTAGHAEFKGTVLRRLNRREYQNAINDLFGTNLNLAALLPPDGRSHEFDNVGAALSISMVQMQRYLDAIEMALDASIAATVTKPEARLVTASYAESREGKQFIGKQWLKLPDNAVVFFRHVGYPTGMLRDANVRTPGFYIVRVTGYAHQSDRPVTFSIGATTFARGAERPTFGYYSMPPGEPTTVEIKVWIEGNYMIQIEPYGISDRNEIRNNGIENYRGPGLAIQQVEVEGPLVEEFPSQGHRLLFSGLDRREVEPRNPNDRKKPWYKPEFEIISEAPGRAVRPVLQRIAEGAFRRPATSEQIQPYAELFDAELAAGATFEAALRTATAAIFCAPEFLFLLEAPGALDDFSLAARLSCFLLRSVPDEPLHQAAAENRLTTDPAEFLRQVDRLLNHPHHDRFLEDFTDAWLNLRDIDFTTPDRTLFPEFDPFLQFSMIEETRSFLRELINRDLPVSNLVRSDFAMLNNRLAAHYDLPDVDGPEIRRVSLPQDSVRGGILSQGSVLKVSANGTNTSPVVRGVWVMERILGIVPPPPPPGIAGVEPDIRGASTLRELLDKHRDLDSCRNCHQMIDPPGFAMESFNPVGGWRDRFRSLGEGERVSLEVNGNKVRYRLGPKVDASGQLADGRSFAGFQQFRDLLSSHQDVLAKAFVTKLLTFATGREMGFSDRAEIDRIVEESAAAGHGLRSMIKLVVLSDIFRSK